MMNLFAITTFNDNAARNQQTSAPAAARQQSACQQQPTIGHSNRYSKWHVVLLCVVAVSLFARTVAYNYDFSLSLKDNARNYNPFHKPIRSQPIKAKKPRALSSITIPMAQTHSDIRKDVPLVKTLTPDCALAPAAPDCLASHELTLQLALFNVEPPDFCALHAVFRI